MDGGHHAVSPFGKELAMNEALLLVILLGHALTAVLATVLLVRVSSAFQSTAKEVRDELRAAARSAGAAARALLEEVVRPQVGHGHAFRTLTALGAAQQTHLKA